MMEKPMTTMTAASILCILILVGAAIKGSCDRRVRYAEDLAIEEYRLRFIDKKCDHLIMLSTRGTGAIHMDCVNKAIDELP